MYKVKHGLVPDCVSQLFVGKCSTHSLRNSDFVLPRFETTRYGKHSVRYLGPSRMAALGLQGIVVYCTAAIRGIETYCYLARGDWALKWRECAQFSN